MPKQKDIKTLVDDMRVSISNHKTQSARTKAELSDRMLAVERRMSKVSERLDLFDTTKTERFLELIRDDSREQHRRVKLILVKLTVGSELSYLIRKKKPELAGVIAPVILRSYDEPDDWWMVRSNYTLNRWISVYLDLAADYANQDNLERDAKDNPRRNATRVD